MTQFNGTNDVSSIAGSSRADVILSAGGADSVSAGAGNDVVFSGTGNDRAAGGEGNDLAAGGAGNDVLGGQEGNDIIVGGVGDDALNGGVGNDILSGGSGADTFGISANAGHDIIADINFAQGDKINFFAGSFENQTRNISVTSVESLLQTINDFCLQYEDMGNNAVRIITGTDSSLTLLNMGSFFGFSLPLTGNASGSSRADVLFGSPVNNGRLVGANGNDTILAGSGNSNIQGNNNDDVIIGGAGNDTIGGQDGNDTLFGNAGNDRFAGGLGNDFLTGDDGADQFEFGTNHTAMFGHDVVTDLNFAEGDSMIFFAGCIPTASDTIAVQSLADLQALIANHSTGTLEHGDNVTIQFGADCSVTLLEFAPLV
ncbi:MAG: calcium-binding protein [Alphaproteobacteria bacterium]|nr:MAG: calcium-binding protein [Alphaproteobacteria bacterium]